MSPRKRYMSTTVSRLAMIALVSTLGCAPLDEQDAEAGQPEDGALDAEDGALDAEDGQVEADEIENKRLGAYACTKEGSPGGRQFVTFTMTPVEDGRFCRFLIFSNRLYKGGGLGFRKMLGVRDTTTRSQWRFMRGRKACIHYNPTCMTVSNVRFGVK